MTFGALLLLAAAPAALPGLGSLAAPLSGTVAVILGCQLALGRATPRLPASWRRRLEGLGLLPKVEARVAAFSARYLPVGGRPLPRRLAGLAVAWSGFLLLLPLALIPFSNTVPALALVGLGAGLQGTRALLGWLGLALSGAFTLVLAGLAVAVAHALR